MSALTKIFVVLLVVLSLLLSAATIVFVNTQTVSAKTISDQKTELARLKQQYEGAQAALNSRDARTQEIMAAKDAQINQDHNDLAAVQQMNAKNEALNAELTAQLASLTAAQTTLSDGLKASQAAIAERTKSYDDLRTQYDKQLAQMVGLNLEIDKLNNTSDVRGRSLMVANEQIAQLQQDLSKQGDILRRYNLQGITDASGTVINPDPGINITAQVQQTREIDRVRYATINVGSADGVAKNMQFNVVDPSRGFLGYITVDSVEPHEAYGKLSGPNASQVQKGAQVRSHL